MRYATHHRKVLAMTTDATNHGGARGELDACTNSHTCTANAHIVSCPSPVRAEQRVMHTAWPEVPLPEEPGGPGGVWAVYAYDGPPQLVVAHASELEAYKAAMYARADGVVWLPYGMGLGEAIKAGQVPEGTAVWQPAPACEQRTQSS